jgi:hypothetical protein
LEGVRDELPARLVLGVGAHGQATPESRRDRGTRAARVEVECLPTDAAVRRYGELDERRAAAALRLPC